MARLSEMAPTTMSSIPVTSKSRCVSLAKTLHAGVYDNDRIIKTPQEIAAAVLEHGGSGLAVHERKQLPNLILQAAYDEFQDAFAREVLQSYSKNDRFWGRLFRSWLLEYNPRGPVGELVTGELKRNLQRLPGPCATSRTATQSSASLPTSGTRPGPYSTRRCLQRTGRRWVSTRVVWCPHGSRPRY